MNLLHSMNQTDILRWNSNDDTNVCMWQVLLLDSDDDIQRELYTSHKNTKNLEWKCLH